MDPNLIYQNPLITRYASRPMAELWSSNRKFSTWRRLWVELARAQGSLGLEITESQIAAMEAAVEKIDFEAARNYESKLRHDVMAHVHTFGDAVPEARAIIHLGATSCFVTDNTDLILLRDGLGMIRDRLVGAIDALATFAERWRAEPCLGYTHYQPAQLVTVGKRATLWCQDLILDLEEIERRIEGIRFLGVKGTTGSQASFLDLFDGDHAKVEELDRRVAEAFGFRGIIPVSGQTYPRKLDSMILGSLVGLAESAHRFGSDLRLLAHDKELEEPFEANQIGSSAMAYKRNPMRAERMCSLSRFLIAQSTAASQTAAAQWLERTLDDSAIRRLVLPQGFLCADALLSLYLDVTPGLVVRPQVIARNVDRELPFMATEAILMAGVKNGGDRQDLHERIRIHSRTAAEAIKQGGDQNPLITLLQNDPTFEGIDLNQTLRSDAFIGRCPEQVDAFLQGVVASIRDRYPNLLNQRDRVSV